MALSPAARHFQKQQAKAATEEPLNGAPTGAELLLASLGRDVRALRDISSHEARADKKREMIAPYMGWVEGVLEADSGTQDPILVTIMIWMLDAGEIASAIPLVEYAVRHELRLPEGYNRGLPCFVADTVGDYAIKQIAFDRPVDTGCVAIILSILNRADVTDQAMAKLHKALGQLRASGEPELALEHFKRAFELDKRCGVKAEITRLTKIVG